MGRPEMKGLTTESLRGLSVIFPLLAHSPWSKKAEMRLCLHVVAETFISNDTEEVRITNYFEGFIPYRYREPLSDNWFVA